MVRSRRTLFIALIVGGPVLLAVAGRMAGTASVSVTVNGGRLGGADVFDTILWLLFLRFAVPVLGVWYGTSLIADEVEEKTITYLFVRPIRRGAVLLGKYLAYLACTSLVVLAAATLVYAAVVTRSSLPESRPRPAPGRHGARPRRLRGALRLDGGFPEAAAGHRPRLCLRVGAGGAARPRLPAAVHPGIPPRSGLPRDCRRPPPACSGWSPSRRGVSSLPHARSNAGSTSSISSRRPSASGQ